MFKLKPPNWYLKSTIGNISLIKQFKRTKERLQPEEEIFNFWLEYFDNATKDQPGDEIKFPILIWEPSKVKCIFNSQFNWIKSKSLCKVLNKKRFLNIFCMQVFVPSYVTVNNGAEIKSLTIKNECLQCIKNNSQCGQVIWQPSN